MRNRAGFTLLEVCLAVAIGLMLITISVPSIMGLLSEQRARKTFDALDALAQEARAHAISERRAYLISWSDSEIVLRPEVPANDNEANGIARVEFDGKKEKYEVVFPAALADKPPLEWAFWPSGACEPATIKYEGGSDKWTAIYDPLTARGNFSTE